MPFDGKNFKPTIKPLQTGLAGLKQLGDALRWSVPDDFGWDFAKPGNHCGYNGCAMGLMRYLWPTQVAYPGDVSVFNHGAVCIVDNEELKPLFGYELTGNAYGKTHAHVTPHDVADAIDRYIAEKEAA